RKKIAAKQQYQLEQFNHYHNLFLTAFTDGKLITDLDIDIFKLLYKPDKHSPSYKALQHITHELKLTPLEFCHKIGLVSDLPKFFTQCFMSDNFHPENHPSYEIIIADPNAFTQRLDLQIFSIDDAATTEIDDAFSVEYKENGYIVGIHIAAPALNSSIAQIAADNLSSVYYPGNKLTMLPECIIQQYSLGEAKTLPVVSIYFNIDNEFNIINYTSAVNVVNIAANLRIEELEKIFNYDSLELNHGYNFENELKLLYQFALKLEEKRGKVSTHTLIKDYNLGFDGDKIYIKPRIRGNPLDKLVSELMILANCSWGRLLTNSFIPAIYRVKQLNYPVKTTLTPDPHCGLNVDYYTWLTSPLRRATDYINQQQLIGLLSRKKGVYTAIDPLLLFVIENFDARYAKYMDFQNKMEKYWSLRYLIQEQITEINAVFIYKTTVQLEGVPIELDLNNFTDAKPKGTQIRLKIYRINLVNLSFEFKLLDNPI
ncbi:MAG: RNB domain-containing ribonuclease, partial [Burkholderiales bacterium]|nr:RNB domain-containing ribonuclease [Burkholderiales bacterium]